MKPDLPTAQLPDPLLNLDYLKELAGDDKDFEREMLLDFTELLPSEMLNLEAAAELRIPSAVGKTAHSLKTTLTFVGLAKVLAPALDILEEAEPAFIASPELPRLYKYIQKVCGRALEESQLLLAQY